LNHLHVIACGVLRGQQAVAGPGRAREAVHDSVVVAIDRVDVDARLLALPHPLALRFPEVRRHPQLAVLGQRHNLLPGLHAPAASPPASAPTPLRRAPRPRRSSAGRIPPAAPYARRGAVPRAPSAAARSGWWRALDRARVAQPPDRLPCSPPRLPPISPSRGSRWP